MTSTQKAGLEKVIVVGAGPAGLLLALMLARAGIPVTVIDMAKDLDKNPRATHYNAPAMLELNRAGVGEDVRSMGFVPGGVCWRKLDGTVLAEIDSSLIPDDPLRMTCLPLDQLVQLLTKHLLDQPSASLQFEHRVVGLGQDADKAWVFMETPKGLEKLDADYVVGCDGANSQIRRTLWGNWEFPGHSWDKQIVATNTRYDFDKFGWHDSNFIIDHEHWFMAAKITKDGLWRVTYGEVPGLSVDEYRQRLPEKFKAMLPGHPSPDEYQVVNFSPYKIHQRLAKSMRSGRFLLAADAAHLCNPFGGLGLTGGIVDVGGLYDCLRGIHEHKADSSILDKYDEIRRQKYSDVTNVISSQNLLRLTDLDPNRALETDGFLKLAKSCEGDADATKRLQDGALMIQHDFTQYYKA